MAQEQLSWTSCKWYAADQADGLDGLMYFVDISYPTSTTGGSYYAALRKGFLTGRVASFGWFPYTDEGLAAARAACDADYATRLAAREGNA